MTMQRTFSAMTCFLIWNQSKVGLDACNVTAALWEHEACEGISDQDDDKKEKYVCDFCKFDGHQSKIYCFYISHHNWLRIYLE